MPLSRREPPSAVRDSVRKALQQFARVPDAELNALRGTKVAELKPESPHEVFNLGLSDLKAGNLDRVQRTGWRYLLRQDADIVASAEAATEPGGAGARFSQFNRGPFVASAAAALDASEDLVDKDKSYEPRLLQIPALYTVILWLHSEDGDDYYVPLEPAPQGIEAGRSYRREELFAILRQKAELIPDMGADDRRGG